MVKSNDGRILPSDSSDSLIFGLTNRANHEVDSIRDSPDSLCNPVIPSANLQGKSGESDKYLLKMSICSPDSHTLDKYICTRFSANVSDSPNLHCKSMIDLHDSLDSLIFT